MIRSPRIIDSVAYIPLTQGYEAIIDADDLELISNVSWSANLGKRTTYVHGWKNGKTVKLHRFIMDAEIGLEVDHIDGNGLNNTRKNLRLATKDQNQFNAKIRRDNKSGVKGVGWHKATQKWRAKIRFGKKYIWLGVYSDINDAAGAYAAASIKYHGEFGCTVDAR